ncbi:MAG: hypothetical protein KME25_18210 [Symplocastrum torsivum CPER-KK1]|uniref:Uncharacterized protein n=1 Tax=Symplocastrum torsivum CPER-KK1 TaxID=450513 RepID=A0A951UAY3_9CYAN|nr:hypothetical protein [Symplocastrum torsivum CPER-KK1]
MCRLTQEWTIHKLDWMNQLAVLFHRHTPRDISRLKIAESVHDKCREGLPRYRD